MRNSAKSDDKEDAFAFAAPPSPEDDRFTPIAPSPYCVGEAVIANHKGCFYQAKVEKLELRPIGWMYFIHYRGWKKHWDEWVGVDRMMKSTDENLQNVTMLDKKDSRRRFQGKAEKLVGCSSKKQVSEAPDDNQTKKRKRVKVEESTPMEKGANVFIPPLLRKQLIDDFEFVKSGKLVKLPRTPNIDQILMKYRDYRKEKDIVISESVEEILNGLHNYFDKALPVLLLYNKERLQYEQATADNVSPSKVYGAEHLLRLFVKLPTLLYNLNIEEDTLMQLQQNLQEVLKFLRKNHHIFFLPFYHVPEHSVTSLKRDDTSVVDASLG